ncbi:MAG: hypothetical protein GEU91_18390 [Rhizobiales bacterium]|nr:hypothetical protein [Hyphomicrobiales bacterium]
MSERYAALLRLAYIDRCLALHGEVQRADITRTFWVSQAQASADIGAFNRTHPGVMAYDKSRKRYVPARAKYRSVYCHDDPNVRRALSLLAAAGHPMGWAD